MVFSFRGRSISTLEVVVFFCGMAIMVVEIVGARMLTPFYGNTFFVWTSIIGVIMVFMSLGYYHGGLEADREGSLKGLSAIIFMGALYTSLLPLTVALGGFFSLISLQWGTIGGAVVSLALPSYYLAKVSPYCIRLASRSVENAGQTSGFIYSISTVGSIFGTFISGFVLIPYFRVKTIVFMFGVLLLLMSLLLGSKKKLLSFIDCLVVAGPIVAQLLWLPSTAALLASAVNANILYEGDSVYNSMSVYEFRLNGTAGSVRLLQLGNLVQGGVYLDSGKSIYEYVPLTQLPWLLNPDIREVLVLGNGAGVGIHYLHSIYPEVNIDVVDIDAKVFDVATAHFPEKEDDRVHFFVDDARLFLKKTDKRYDLILMDVYGSTHQIPSHLVTDEMVREVRDHLTEKGVYLQNVVSALEGPSSIVLKSVVKTSEATFRSNYVLPVEANDTKPSTVVVMSFDWDAGDVDVEDFLRQVPESEREYVNKSLSRYFLGNPVVNTTGGMFFTDDYAPTETMMS